MLDHFRMILKKKKATSSRRQAELDNDSKVGGWAQKPQARRRNYNQA